jgi:hypothetical protein
VKRSVSHIPYAPERERGIKKEEEEYTNGIGHIKTLIP